MPVVKYEDYERGQHVGGEYMRLEDGENRVRVISEPYQFERTFREEEGPRVRFGWAVLDKEMDEPAVKYLEVGPMIYSQVAALASDEDYGDPVGYDLKIKKSGEGLDTTYHVVPGKPEPLTKKEKGLVEDANIDLEMAFGESAE